MTDTVGEWLEGIDLGKYAQIFAENEIDREALPLMTAEDLKEIGIPVGARRKMLAAIAEIGHDNLPASLPEVSRSTDLTDKRAGAGDASLRQITILFIDVVGSTALSRKLDPETMRDVIRRYQDAIAGVTLRFGGHVAKFLGDGVLAYFGWPHAYEDQADRAIHAGLDAISAVQGIVFEDGLVLHSRVGIASGEVIVGDLLGDTVVDTDAVIGETPNLAARLQGVAEPDQLVICATTVKLTSEAFDIDKPFSTEIKGFDQPVDTYRVLGKKKIKSRFDQRRMKTHGQLIGRNHELGLLLDRWEQACSNEGQLVILSGEAGIGKSRLVQSFLEHADVQADFIAHLQCSPLHNNSPFYPVIQYLENMAGIYSEDGPEIRREKITPLLDRYTDDDSDSGEAILALLGLPVDTDSEFFKCGPEQRKTITFQAVKNHLVGTVDDRTSLLVIEDAHWIDPTTMEFLEQIIMDFATTSVLAIVTHRPVWTENWSQTIGHASTISLGKLSLKQVSNMVIEILGGPVSVDIIDKISERADGNPLYVEEIAKSILTSADIAGGNTAQVPETLQASLMAQIDNLGSSAQELAQIASVIGREFSYTLILQIHSLSEKILKTAIDEMIKGQFIHPSGSAREEKYIFRHALIQETIYNSLLRDQRRELHKNVADAIVFSKRDGMRSQDELVAEHYQQAGLSKKAIPYWRMAGKQASSRASGIEAILFFTNALKLVEMQEDTAARSILTAQIMNQLGNAQNLASQLDGAIKTYLRSVEISKKAGATPELVEAALGLEQAEFYSGKLEYHSSIVLPDVLEILGDEPTIERCRILGYLGRAICSVGDPEEGYKISRDATELARTLGNDQVLLDAFSVSLTLWHLPQNIDQRLKDAEEFTRLAKKIATPEVIFRNLSLRIAVLAEVGDAVLFNKLIEEVGSNIRTHQLPLQHWVYTCSLAMQAMLTGNFEKAESIANQALDRGGKVNSENAEGVYGVQMFTIRREQGRLAEIAPFIKKITDENPQDAIWRPGLALIASELGFMEPARKIFNQLAQNNFSLANDAKLSTTLSYLAEVCARLEDKKRAVILYDLLFPYSNLNITIGVAVLCIGSADRFLGLLATTREDYSLAENHFEIALKMNQKMEALPWLAHTQTDYAMMLRGFGRAEDIGKSEALLASARNIATDLNMSTLLDQIQRVKMSEVS